MNDVELLQYGLDEGLHKKEGWLWRRLIIEGVVEDLQKKYKKIKVFQSYQAHKIFIMAQIQLMPKRWDPLDPKRRIEPLRGTVNT